MFYSLCRNVVFVVLFCTTAMLCAAKDKNESDKGIEFFEKKIRPVLVTQCYKCHSAKSVKVKGGLLVDSRDGLLKGGASGPAIVPKQPKKSLLLKAVSYSDADLQMPPKNKLSAQQIKDLETWIKMGAPDPRRANVATAPAPLSTNLWSLKPVVKPALPKVRNTDWAKSPVDLFILAKLEDKNLTPVAPANKRTLIRRATFDLIGLPPTPEEIDAFLKDKSPQAFERVVERLLASPHYGERWGRHWLDLVRYADTSGCNSDFPVPSAYRYRNYVIDSFNSDKPYPEFIREQIAGDLLPAKTVEQRNEHIIATGYLAISRRFGSRAQEMHLTLEDTIDNLGKTMLGLSVGCARCHDHKFDPIPTRDYYALYGIFNSTRYAFPGTEVYRHPKNFVPLNGGTNMEEVVQHESELSQLDDELEKLSDEKRALRRFDKARHDDDKTEEATPEQKQKLLEIKAAIEDVRTRQKLLESEIPNIDRAYAVSEGTPANAKIQIRGIPYDLGAEAPRGFLQVLGGQTVPADEKGSGRRELAQWVTATNNPLTWRVMANRIWEYHFGRGLVQTASDFGTRGKPPTHPELLDYLASRFLESGGSIKHMHRLIMLSQAYQLSAAENDHDYATDVNNDFLWRFNRQRLEAEEIRDTILAVSGALDLTRGEGHPFPPESEWKYTQHKPFVADYESNRRSVYLMQQRIRQQPFLALFDGADANATTAERPLSASPLQALFLMNDSFVYAQADNFAVRLALAFTKTADRINYAYQLAFGRPATRGEIRDTQLYLKQCGAELTKAGTPVEERSRTALASFARVIFSSNEFFFVE
ncbi:MAG: PSD1 and planctomycete cytochrome C domain-containing protein [Limisphaerales bacterium]